MKIAVASDNGNTLTGHVGRCEMFIVFEILSDEIINKEKRINSFTMHKTGHHNHDHSHEHHGTGRHAGIINGLKDCNYLVCSSCGPGLIDDLFANGVQIILTEEMEAEKAVKQFIEGKLVNDPDRKCEGHKH